MRYNPIKKHRNMLFSFKAKRNSFYPSFSYSIYYIPYAKNAFFDPLWFHSSKSMFKHSKRAIYGLKAVGKSKQILY
jgi:hypothetical protein